VTGPWPLLTGDASTIVRCRRPFRGLVDKLIGKQARQLGVDQAKPVWCGSADYALSYVTALRWMQILRPFAGVTELVLCLACVGFGLAGGVWVFWAAAALLAVLGTWNLVERHAPGRRRRVGLALEPVTQPGAAGLVRLLQTRRVLRRLLRPGQLHPGPVPAMGAAQNRRITVKTIRRRYCNNGWWPTTPEIGLFNPDKVRTTRYHYRGTAIPTPWPATG
jgi:hypothetical protein